MKSFTLLTGFHNECTQSRGTLANVTVQPNQEHICPFFFFAGECHSIYYLFIYYFFLGKATLG